MSRTIKTRVWDEDSKEFVYISQTDDGSLRDLAREISLLVKGA